MKHRFDVVAVRVEHKGAVIAGMVITKARRTIILAAVGERCLVEGIDHGLIPSLESQMMPTGQLTRCGGAVGAGNHQFISPEKAVCGTADGYVQDVQDSGIETPAGGKILDHKLDVVD